MANKQPFEQDIDWLKNDFRDKNRSEPTEIDIDLFIEKVAIFCADGHDELTARRMAVDVVASN